jgi:hypothetical protein
MFQVPNGGVEPGPGGVHDHGGGVVDQLGDGSRDSAPSAGCAGLDSRARVMAATPVVLPLVVTLLPKPGDRPAQPLGSPLDLQALDGRLVVAYQAAVAVAVASLVIRSAAPAASSASSGAGWRWPPSWSAAGHGPPGRVRARRLRPGAGGGRSCPPPVG